MSEKSENRAKFLDPQTNAQDAQDWNSLLWEICKTFVHLCPDSEWADADEDQMDEFDPWQALRTMQALRGLAASSPPEKFLCAAQHSDTGANDPQDCDWPFCGCDQYADKVIAELQESGVCMKRNCGAASYPHPQVYSAADLRRIARYCTELREQLKPMREKDELLPVSIGLLTNILLMMDRLSESVAPQEFPNATPGPQEKRPPMPTNFTWFSVCSGHSCSNPEHDHGALRYCSDCGRCNAGRWVNDELQEFTSWLFKRCPDIWREWANRETHVGEPGHESRTFLERVFPGLRRKS